MGRVFFLSAHKILIKTELVRLRELGFEVFCPPYRPRSSAHQSLTSEWDRAQPTTLPADVFEELAAFDFFGNRIPSRIAALLNRHFETVIVTSDPGWLVDMLEVYRGRLVFRVYGQIVVLSDYLFAREGMGPIVERDNFWFVPHADEAVLLEHAWIKRRMRVVPYVPSDSALKLQGTWRLDRPHAREMMVVCPNLENPYYRAHYEYLKRNFSEDEYRYYGVQMGPVNDPQVVGTLTNDEYFNSFSNVAGLMYSYREPTVCFLPPIEMMIAGGPVVFLRGSLLCRMMPDGAPGRARDEDEARSKCRRLLDGDEQFALSIIASQQDLTSRFAPEHVWPRFDAVFRELLGPESANQGETLFAAEVNPGATWVLVPPEQIQLKDGRYVTASAALARLQAEVSKLLANGDVVLAVSHADAQLAHGYFAQDQLRPERLRIFFIDRGPGQGVRSVQQGLLEKVLHRLRRLGWAVSHRIVPTARLARAIAADAACDGVIACTEMQQAHHVGFRFPRSVRFI